MAMMATCITGSIRSVATGNDAAAGPAMTGPPPAVQARRLVRAADRAALATAMADGAWPYASLVLVACDHDATPILLLSDLADHAKNIAADSRVSLLFDGTAGLEEPLTGARVTVLGRAERSEEPRLKARYLARHPSASRYAGFGDFAIYRVAVERAHLVAGFGRIKWMARADLLYDAGHAGELAGAEPGIVEHMNAEHADALDLCARFLLGRPAGAWTMTGIDPEGCDLRAGGKVARLSFAAPVKDADGARKALVGLVGEARKKAGN